MKIPGTEIEGAGYGDQLEGPSVTSFIEKNKVQNEGGRVPLSSCI